MVIFSYRNPIPEEAENVAKRVKRVSEPMVSITVNGRTYHIDPGLKKVYRRFVEIETAKASEILSHWRATSATA